MFFCERENQRLARVTSCVLILILFTLSACEKEDDIDVCNPENRRGELIEVTRGLSFTPERIMEYLTYFGVPIEFVPEYSIDAYRVVYKTENREGELTTVSGAMFIPNGINEYDIISVQHGTNSERDLVGSANPILAFDAMLYASKGYLTIAPDYLGLGKSQVLHPYLNAELSANPVIDMVRATRSYACQEDLALSEELFLAGYSEGGFVTMATHKFMETEYSEEFQLTGVAPMSGPYDLLMTTTNILEQSQFSAPGLLAFVVASYDDVYNWDRLDDFFRAPYDVNIPDLFDGSRGIGYINDQLPNELDSLFESAFRSSFLQGGEPVLETALAENSLLGWGPIAPVRLYHGTSDEIVSFENSVSAQASLVSNGGISVDLVPLNGATHPTGFFPSMMLAEAWFDSLRTAN